MISQVSGNGRQIGLFGGSFNPPHICHALATLWALQTHQLDEIWWIPTYNHAFAKTLCDFDHRYEMCQLATRHLKDVSVIDIERQIGGESRTIDTVQVLKSQFPDDNFWLIVGADIMEQCQRWKNWDGLMAMVNLLVVGRVGYHLRSEGDAILSQIELPDISSTKIREALLSHDESLVRAWLAADVIEYIKAHNLFRLESF